MITLGIILAILGTGYLIQRTARRMSNWEMAGELLVIFGAVLLLFYVCVGLSARYIVYPIAIEKFESVERTVERARANGESLEDAALQHKVVEQNKWLAAEKWWSKSDVGFFIPPKIDSLEPIE